MKQITCYNVKPWYLIDKNGNIYKDGNKLKSHRDHNGYLQVRLTQNDKKRGSFLIHRLVALTYIPNPNNLETVNHIDGNKLNNNISNLEWMSRMDNVNDAKRLGYNGNYTDISKELIQQVINDLEFGKSVKQICNDRNCSINFVTRIRQGKRHKSLERTILSVSRKMTLLQKKEICYLIQAGIKDKYIQQYYDISKSYCYNIRKGKSLQDVYKFVKENNFEPSTTIKNYFNLK